jgi:hypothetical protein
MKWFRRKPLPAIPPYQPIEVRPRVKDDGIEVKEGSLSDIGIDAESLTQTGVHRAWNKLTRRFK